MARPDKAAAVAELTEKFRSSTAAVLTEYRGLTVAQLKELRRALGDDTHVRRGEEHADQDRGAGGRRRRRSTSLLAGPSAIAFIKGDPVEAAKGLRDFAKANPLLVIKGGVLDGKPLTADEITKLADLESREVLLAKLAGAMKASLPSAASLFAAPLAQAARLVEALRGKAEAQRARAAPAAEARAERSARGTERADDRSRGTPADAERSAGHRAPPRPSAQPHRETRRRAPQADRIDLPPHTTEEGPPPWRSSAPTSCSTRSRR